LAGFVAWVVEFGDELEPLRRINANNIPALVNACVKGSMRDLARFDNGEEIISHARKLVSAYESGIQPMIRARGGLAKCPAALYGSAATIVVNVVVFCRVLEEKYLFPSQRELYGRVLGDF
jgi:hypothetical protein